MPQPWTDAHAVGLLVVLHHAQRDGRTSAGHQTAATRCRGRDWRAGSATRRSRSSERPRRWWVGAVRSCRPAEAACRNRSGNSRSAPAITAAYGCPTHSRGTSARSAARGRRRRCPPRWPRRPPSNAGSSSGGCTPHPSGFPSCRWCNTLRRRSFVQIGPVELDRLAVEQIVVADHGLTRGGQRRHVALADGHDRLHRRHLRQHRGQQRRERHVHQHNAILGLVGDERDLLAGQPDVQRVQHRAHARCGEVGLEVLLVVPHERRDAIPVRHTQVAQPVSELRHPRPQLAEADVAVPVGVAVMTLRPEFQPVPCRRMPVTVSGKSCIVLCMNTPMGCAAAP